jgi:hypothetical protein
MNLKAKELESSRVVTTNIKERTNCYGIHHERDHGNTPSYYKLANRIVFLKGVAEHEETTDVQRNSYVACPVSSQAHHRAVRAAPQ